MKKMRLFSYVTLMFTQIPVFRYIQNFPFISIAMFFFFSLLILSFILCFDFILFFFVHSTIFIVSSVSFLFYLRIHCVFFFILQSKRPCTHTKINVIHKEYLHMHATYCIFKLRSRKDQSMNFFLIDCHAFNSFYRATNMDLIELCKNLASIVFGFRSTELQSYMYKASESFETPVKKNHQNFRNSNFLSSMLWHHKVSRCNIPFKFIVKS